MNYKALWSHAVENTLFICIQYLERFHDACMHACGDFYGEES